RLLSTSFFLRRLQLADDLFGWRWLCAKDCRDRKIILQHWEVSVMHFQLIACFCVRIAICIEITNTHDVFKRLRAHRSSVHPQAATDCSGNSLHPLQSAEASRLTRIGDL